MALGARPLGSAPLASDESSVALSKYYPGSTISSGGWTPSIGASLFATIDETTADDADYDVSGFSPVSDTMEVKFAGVQIPSANTNHKISYRIKGDPGIPLVVSLYCAATLIKAWTHNPAPTSFTTYAQTLTTAEANTITDYSDLRFRAVAG